MAVGAAVGAGAGVVIDAGAQVLDIAFNRRALSSFNWGQTIRSGVAGAVGGAVGGGFVAGSGLIAGALGITAASSGATAAGVLTVGLSGVVGGRAASIVSNSMSGLDPLADYWNPLSMARDAAFAIGGAKLLGMGMNALMGTNINPFTSFMPQNFSDLMPRSEALRYNEYWKQESFARFLSGNTKALPATSSLIFDDLTTGAKRLVSNFWEQPAGTRLSIGNGMLANDFSQASQFLGVEIGVAQTPTNELFAILGRQQRTPFLPTDTAIFHTHPVWATDTTSHFQLDIRYASNIIEAVIDWGGNITHFNNTGILPNPSTSPINSYGYVVGYR